MDRVEIQGEKDVEMRSQMVVTYYYPLSVIIKSINYSRLDRRVNEFRYSLNWHQFPLFNPDQCWQCSNILDKISPQTFQPSKECYISAKIQ
ncbi:MAG: hypothetical protein EZS28_032617 [Streblomastix strix]|uniref:Uncharacterized protein n=1 Tax=Streblomastix strix TaxID=222440 RepID=A0A5J4UN54_9EUKA|nr:MAG: hypothetical protein EZS28_032617 [Streblomastix strix]